MSAGKISKACKSCGKIKPMSEFHKRADMKDGYRNVCKLCRKQNSMEANLAYYEANKEKKLEYNKEFKRNKRNKLLKQQREEKSLREYKFQKAVTNWLKMVVPSIYT